MSEKKRFVILLILVIASVVLLVFVRSQVGQNFTNQF